MACNVALLAEGVDRNNVDFVRPERHHKSPSSRRAWIEIRLSVIDNTVNTSSPSSRRAWIEIPPTLNQPNGSLVALLAEGVDRNSFTSVELFSTCSSPSSRRAWIEIVLLRSNR